MESNYIMQNSIIIDTYDNSKAVITLWDHFWVNRLTGSTIEKAFTAKFLDGPDKGKSFIYPISVIGTGFLVCSTK